MAERIEPGAVLPLLLQWQAASDSGDSDAAMDLVLAIVAARAPPDDGTGEARGAIGKILVSALASGSEEAARRVLDDERQSLEEAMRTVGAVRGDPEDLWVPASQIEGDPPPMLLSLAGKKGAVLIEGSIAIVSGAGGIAKSSLLQHVILGFSMLRSCRSRSSLDGGVFDAPTGGGRVLCLSYENRPTLIRDGLLALSRHLDDGDEGEARDAVDGVIVRKKRPGSLFGPTDRGESAGLYNARPDRLEGWADMVRAIDRFDPRLVVIDPGLSAYVGDSNSAAPVREFLDALIVLAEERGLGVVVVAHSTKSARKGKVDLMDPGQVGGSSHWHDTVRGVLVLNRDEEDPQARVLACPKANLGPDRLILTLDGIRGDDGQYLGFVAANDRGWRSPSPPKDEKGEAARTNRRGRRGNGRSLAQFASGVS